MPAYRQKHPRGGAETDRSLIYKSVDYSFWGSGGNMQDGFPFQVPLSAVL